MSNNKKVSSRKGYLYQNSKEFSTYIFHILRKTGSLGLESWTPAYEPDAPTYLYSKS